MWALELPTRWDSEALVGHFVVLADISMTHDSDGKDVHIVVAPSPMMRYDMFFIAIRAILQATSAPHARGP